MTPNHFPISKIEKIEKQHTCPVCKKGICKLKMFYVSPKTGNLTISYGRCSELCCRNNKGYPVLTNIRIKELALGE